jgi:hypothetical protein
MSEDGSQAHRAFQRVRSDKGHLQRELDFTPPQGEQIPGEEAEKEKNPEPRKDPLEILLDSCLVYFVFSLQALK